MAPATDPRGVLIVAHGSPSSPDAQERAIAALAGRVARLLPGRRAEGATLAGDGTLAAALEGLGDAPLVYPLFMSDGWFVSTALPKRLRAASRGTWSGAVLPPLGLDPALKTLCLTAATEGATERGLVLKATTLLLAAHGSPSDARPKLAAKATARHIASTGRFRSVLTGFVDEAPFLQDAARLDGPALCLPFFATRAGHVTHDIPESLAAASFSGPTLSPIGVHEDIPGVIADAVARADQRCAA